MNTEKLSFAGILAGVVAAMRCHDHYPTFYVIEQILGGGEQCVMGGRACIHMGSNGYLGLQHDPRVLEAATTALQQFGLGSSGSRITAGTHASHIQLEEKLAEFEGNEAAVIFSSGFNANVAMIQALACHPMKGMLDSIDKESSKELFQPDQVELIFDRLAHRSMITGIEAALGCLTNYKPKVSTFRNGDVDDLRKILRNSDRARKLTIIDTVYSLHGRRAPVAQIAKACKEFGSDIYADEAHATGIYGANGRGMVEEDDCCNDVQFRMGTLSKAIGSEGGFFTGPKDLCDAFRVSVPAIFGTSMAPAVAAGTTKAIEIIQSEPERRRSLRDKAEFFRNAVQELGYDILGSTTHIVPVRFYTKPAAQAATQALFERGIFAPTYYHPAVGRTEAMVRMNIMATHSDEQLEYVVDALKKLRHLVDDRLA